MTPESRPGPVRPVDPHSGAEARAADLARYPAAVEIRRLMTAAGFVETETREAHHIRYELSVTAADSLGMLERSSTSQLMVISDDVFRDGINRIRAARPEPGEEQPLLRADLRLYATIGRLPSQRVWLGPGAELDPAPGTRAPASKRAGTSEPDDPSRHGRGASSKRRLAPITPLK